MANAPLMEGSGAARLMQAAQRAPKPNGEVGATAVSNTVSSVFGGTSTAMSALMTDEMNETQRGA